MCYWIVYLHLSSLASQTKCYRYCCSCICHLNSLSNCHIINLFLQVAWEHLKHRETLTRPWIATMIIYTWWVVHTCVTSCSNSTSHSPGSLSSPSLCNNQHVMVYKLSPYKSVSNTYSIQVQFNLKRFASVQPTLKQVTHMLWYTYMCKNRRIIVDKCVATFFHAQWFIL